ncbi:NADP-dependent succinic semialdehyde dehydrogenase [Marinicauda salina]|uniref:NADP-dependent succinic semialdehyde dehydrogenase n=1 Tax=Marinicauda salina TaxID=2135793 RepID=A0A2U2BUI3_9PROT|nr:NAD-dependent succinate-semialdehyde dehydrogenase [Marinicauda salina]PWE17668.1 NADP-dependent succinic semialdehyde dehydrogenase [Marinicauda salina]
MTIRSINPATGEELETFEAHDEAEIDSALARAERAIRRLGEYGLDGRAERLIRAADILESEAEAFGRMMTAEMGKPLAQAKAEAEKCAWACRHYAETGADMLADEPIEAGDKGRAFVRRLPLGPIFAIMPWNFPFWQVFRFAAPNLMAGNPGVLKHASNVPRCALAIEQVLHRAGFEAGCFQSLLIGSDLAGDVIADDRIRGVTLTGSEKAGAAVARQAGAAIKPTVLELGGSDAFIVMPSADLDEAVETGVAARIQNNGQSCIAAKRFIVHEDVYTEFRDRFVAALEAKIVGDPMHADTDIGPLVDETAAETLMGQVDDTVKAGGKAVLAPEKGRLSFVTPGVLEQIPPASPGYREELFGPVALMFKAADLDAAIRLANDHAYGLGSSLWSSDEAEIEAAASRLEAGSTYVNQMVASDPRLPFGGVKKSGYGRELAREGLFAFTNAKTIAIR